MAEITREEFDTFKESIVSFMGRIEGKIDNFVVCIYDRTTWEAFDRYKEEVRQEMAALKKGYEGGLAGVAKEVEAVKNRPSWLQAAIISFLGVTSASGWTLLLTHVLR